MSIMNGSSVKIAEEQDVKLVTKIQTQEKRTNLRLRLVRFLRDNDMLTYFPLCHMRNYADQIGYRIPDIFLCVNQSSTYFHLKESKHTKTTDGKRKHYTVTWACLHRDLGGKPDTPIDYSQIHDEPGEL